MRACLPLIEPAILTKVNRSARLPGCDNLGLAADRILTKIGAMLRSEQGSRWISAAIAAIAAASLIARPELWPDGAALPLRAVLAALLLGTLLCCVHAAGLRPSRRPLAAIARPPLAWLPAITGIAGVLARDLLSGD